MRVFVVGGTGFVGRALVPLLLERGHTPLVLSRKPMDLPRERSGSRGTSSGRSQT
jgi:uncharacterized protein YbjT (DUF2867 family)